MITKQQIFDLVKLHLLTQNAKAVNSGSNNCRYRSDNGLKCAVGCLISDEAYSSRFEGQLVYDENVARALLASGINTSDPEIYSLLYDLQTIHDGLPVELWSQRLATFAELHELENTNVK